MTVTQQQMLWFLVVGSIGFMIDGGGLFVLTEFFDWSPITARVVSMPLAILVTFLMNRYLTFKAKNLPWVRAVVTYITANAVSQGINFGLYTLLVLAFAVLYQEPMVALVMSSAVAMVFSFLLSKYWVFKQHD